MDGFENAATPGEALWTPPGDVRNRTRVGAYLRWLEHDRGLRFDGYAQLWQWSVTDLPAFWSSIWDYFEVGRGQASAPAATVLGQAKMPGAEWFPGATLNYAEQVLRDVPEDEIVVLGRSQTRDPIDLTGAQLWDAVARARTGLRRLGVGPGDRVAAYLPNIPETFVLLLAAASLGAVFSSCAPEFGTRAVLDRLRQIRPKVFVCVDGYRYGDRDVDRSEQVRQIRTELPSLARTVKVSYLSGDPVSIPDALSWSDLLAEREDLAFEPVPFAHPLYVLYSSGTTGLPKAIVHGHGGILLEHLKALALHMDLGPGDRFFWFTTTGWMMWNYLVSGPAVGSAIVLFDGNPSYPDLTALWDLAAETEMTYFGASASYLMGCRKARLCPRERFDTSAIKGIASTGSPLPAEGFGWVYRNVNSTLLLQSFSGGTDVCTGFVGGSPLLPVRAGEIACRCLGAAVAAYDESGRPVTDRLGELVIEQPMPSMPVGLWGDDAAMTAYKQAYFDTFPGVWRHGDWVRVSRDGSCVITGRSDATLKRGGVRLGTAEFYAVVESLPEIADSLVVHGEVAGDAGDTGRAGELLLFVVPADGVELDEGLRARIVAALRQQLSPRHVPDAVYAVPAVPRTLSGKKLEVPVKRILAGEPSDRVVSRGALADPEALAVFEELARVRRSPR